MDMYFFLVAVLTMAVIETSDMMYAYSAMEEKSVCDKICICIDEIFVNCSSRDLKEVPDNIPDDAFELDLSFNNLQLHDGDFAEYESLRHLDLSFNHLKTMPRIFQIENSSYLGEPGRNSKNSGTTYVRLTKIDLSGNHLRCLPEDLLHTAQDLISVYFAENHLESLPAMLFSNSSWVEELSFAFNNIMTLPETIFIPLRVLKMLVLSSNLLHSLSPRLFENNRRLQMLLIDDNKLISLPPQMFFQTKRLSTLNISGNLLQELPAELFKNTPEIVTFICNNNKLKEIPDDLMTDLKIPSSVYFSGNNLQSLPDIIFPKECWIYMFELSNNFVKIVPKEIFQDVFLTYKLDMSMNSILALPAGLFNMSGKYHTLTTLFLHRNKLTYLQKDVFLGLPKLKMLCLFENKISAIGLNVFGISALENIYLFDNELTTFSHDWFKTNNKSTIYLFDNDITKISGCSRDILKRNNTLYVNCNHLEELQRFNVKIICVGPSFAPKVQLGYDTLDEYMARIFQQKGFTCERNSINKMLTCEACQRGSYSNGQNECILCPKGGFYQDKIGQKAPLGKMNCQLCPNGTYVRTEGGLSEQNCTTCPDGTIKNTMAGFRACPCRDGFARNDRFEKCSPCSQTGLMCKGQDFQSLKPGFFWDWNFSSCSLKAYNNFVVNLRTENRFYDNNTQYHKEIPRVHKCPRPSSCLNDFPHGNTSVESKCSLGYTGWLCTQCQPGLYSVLNFCRTCPEKFFVFFKLFLMLGVCFLLCCLICWNSRDCHTNNYNRNGTDRSISEVKIVLGFYQVIGVFLASFNDVNWIKFYAVGDFISLMEMNVMKILIRPLCLSGKFAANQKNELVVSLIVLLAIIGSSLFSYVVMKNYTNTRRTGANVSQRLTSLREKTLTVVVFLLFLTYPQICLSIFQLFPFACRTFCLDLRKRHCFAVLRSDFAVHCDQLEIYHALAFASTVGYVLAFPLILLYNLHKHCHAYLNQRKRRIFWMKSIKKKEPSASLASKEPENKEVPLYLNFLYENYKAKYWYWEVVELTRKVLQTLFIALLGWENRITALITFGISVFFLILHAKHVPMKTTREQSLQMLSLTAIVTDILFIAVETPNGYRDVFPWFLLILNGSLIFIFLLQRFLDIIVLLKHVFQI